MQSRFRETLPCKRPEATQWLPLLQTWIEILSNRTFQAYALLMMGAFGALFTFLSSSAFVLMEVLGLGRLEYGLVMFSLSVSYILGTLLCRRLLLHWGPLKTIQAGSWMSLTGGTLMFALNRWEYSSVFSLLLPFFLIMVAHGIHQPISQSGAVAPFPMAAGAASALSGFLMMLVAFAIGRWMGTHLDGSVFPLIGGELFWSLWIAIAGLVVVQRQAQRHD